MISCDDVNASGNLWNDNLSWEGLEAQIDGEISRQGSVETETPLSGCPSSDVRSRAYREYEAGGWNLSLFCEYNPFAGCDEWTFTLRRLEE